MIRFRLLIVTIAALLTTGTGVALAASSPTVTTGPAASIGDTTATLTGSVNPDGAKTTYLFEWGPTSALGYATKAGTIASGTKRVSVHSSIAGLAPGSPFYYRLVASNSSGSSVGTIRSFRTSGNPPPQAITGAAANISKYGATLTGVVNPQNQLTTYFFEYGLSQFYGLQTAPATVAAGGAAVPVSAVLSGLEPGATFHYRLVVEHGSQATSDGQDVTFTTFPFNRPRPRIVVATVPRRRARVPVTYTTLGRIREPASTPSGLACSGTVRVTYRLGSRAIRTLITSVQANCTFATVTRFGGLPGRGRRGRTVTLSVQARFLGNGYVAPVSSRVQRVSLH